jgi:hypothetical protein
MEKKNACQLSNANSEISFAGDSGNIIFSHSIAGFGFGNEASKSKHN